MNDFFSAVRSFLLEFLPNQRCFSTNTIRSYRQALNLLISYLRTEQGLPIKQIQFDKMAKEDILCFLDWLEVHRGCSASTRNQRLMALRSFFAYAGELDCMQIALGMTVRSIPLKTSEGKVVEHLSETVLAALLQQPNTQRRTDLRYGTHV